MAKSYNVSFNILGNLDSSLLSAIRQTQEAMESLGKLNGKALAAAQKLASDKNLQAQIAQYRELQQAARAAAQGRTQELLAASRLNAQRTIETKKLDNMRAAYQQLQRTQQRLKDESQLRRNELDLARAALKNAKATGDIDAIKAAQNALRAAQIAAKDAAQAVRDINVAARQGKADLKAQENSVKTLGNNFAQASAKAQELQRQLQQQQQTLAQLRTTLPAGNLAHQEAQLQDQIQRTTAALNQEIAALERRNQIQQNFSRAQQDLANAYSNFQNSLQTAQTIMSPFTSAIDKAVAFEHTMSTLKSISQMDLIKAGNIEQAETNMRRLELQAKQLGATTIFTAQQIGEAQVYVARTGWNTDAIEKSMPSILKLAAANRMEIEPTADIITNIMTAFGHGTDQVEHDADVLNYTVTHSNQTLSQMGEALKYAAPVAKLFGATLEEAAMMTKFMGDAGIQGSMAGTSMRQTMLRLTAPTKNARKAMESMGMSMSDARKAQMEAIETAAAYGVTLDESLSPGRQFINIMKQIDEGMAGKSDQEKLAALKDITGVTAVSGAANVFGAGAGQAENFTKLLEQCEGALSQTYDVMTSDTYGAQKSFESAWEAVQLSIGQSLLSITQAGYEFAAPLLTSLSQFIDEHPQVVQACAAIATAVASATVAVAGFSLTMAGIRFAQAGFATAGLMIESLKLKAESLLIALRGLTFANIGASLSSGLAAASTAARAFGAAMLTASRAALAFVFTPVGAALTAIAVAAYYAYTHWERVGPAIESVMNTLSGLMGPVEGLMQALSNINFDGITSAAGALADTVGGTLCGAFIALLGVAGTVLAAIVNFFADLVKTVVDFSNNLTNVFTAIGNADFSGAANGLKNLVMDVGKDLNNIGADFVNTITAGLSGTNEALQIYANSQPTVTGTMEAGLIDTSSAQVNVDALGASAQNASTNLEAVNQAGQMALQAGTQFQTGGDSARQASEAALQAGAQFQTAGESALSAVGSMQALSDGASAVAGALSAKAAEIGSITIPQPQLQVVTLTQVASQNAKGGIYQRGAFLTTFAENSAEAAIPLDKSARAINLWTQAGQILGVLPNEKKTPSLPSLSTSFTESLPFNITINVTVNGNADKDSVRDGITEALPFVRQTFEEQFNAYMHERKRRSFL